MLPPGIAVAQLRGILEDLREEVPRIKAGARACRAVPLPLSALPVHTCVAQLALSQ